MIKRVVYSTESGRHCPKCFKPIADCVCGSKRLPNVSKPNDGIVRLQRQSKGRKGKPVTLITGLDLDVAAVKILCKQLKSSCGVGGTIMQEGILIQGDKRTVLSRELQQRGFKVKISSSVN